MMHFVLGIILENIVIFTHVQFKHTQDEYVFKERNTSAFLHLQNETVLL